MDYIFKFFIIASYALLMQLPFQFVVPLFYFRCFGEDSLRILWISCSNYASIQKSIDYISDILRIDCMISRKLCLFFLVFATIHTFELSSSCFIDFINLLKNLKRYLMTVGLGISLMQHI